jgi:hypothetical protein
MIKPCPLVTSQIVCPDWAEISAPSKVNVTDSDKELLLGTMAVLKHG